MEIEVLSTKTANIWKDEEGIIHQESSPNSVEVLKTAKENNDAIEKLSGKNKCLLLANATNLKSMTRESRNYYSRSEQSKRLYKAVAVVSNTKTGNVIGNFFLGFNKPPFPYKMFYSEDEAKAWLKNMKD